MTLFPPDINDVVIRTLCLYQPFCSLMMHGKKETRLVRIGKKPPYVPGLYLFYSAKKPCNNQALQAWCSWPMINRIHTTLKDEPTRDLNGYALCMGEFTGVRLMTKQDEQDAFVSHVGVCRKKDKNGIEHEYVQWILNFENVQRIKPFEFKYGKQGVGILPKSEYSKIQIATENQLQQLKS